MTFDKYCEHEFAVVGRGTDSETVPITGFDYDELFRRLDGQSEKTESEGSVDYGEALIAILAWLVGDHPIDPDSPFGISSRVLGLAWMLRPDLVPGFKGFTDIGRHCGVTKQAISKSISEFERSTNWIHCRHFKGEGSTENYRAGAKQGWKTRLRNIQKRHDKRNDCSDAPNIRSADTLLSK